MTNLEIMKKAELFVKELEERKQKMALLLTAYERFGSVGCYEFEELYIDECLLDEIDESTISDYNEYLSENGYECYYDDLEMLFDGMDKVEVARCTFYGDFHFAYEYHKFNGYGNLDSFEGYHIIKEMKSDRTFLRWLVERDGFDLFDDDDIEEIIAEANELIKKGY